MLKIGTDIEVLKGKHKGKTGVIEKIHAVYVTILFENGSSGRTLPSSLKVTVVPFESTEAVRDFEGIDAYRSLSIELMTTMIAQGLSLAENPDDELKKVINHLENCLVKMKATRMVSNADGKGE